MKQSAGHKHEHADLESIPHPIIARMKWFYPLVWLVPIAAAALAGYYFFERRQERGPQITIQFRDVNGFRPGETLVNHLGVQIGRVEEVTLSADNSHADAHVQLHRSASDFARVGARFWVIKPQFSAESITGLSTFFSGPYVESEPGKGAETNSFVGLEKAPPPSDPVLIVLLHAPRLEHLQTDSGVYYRGIQVGTVRDVQLSQDSTGIDVRIAIDKHFAPLVHNNSCFWVVKGADIEGGLLSGVQLKLGSLRAIISGGINFATPNTQAPRADDGADFPLYDEPKKDWITWSPRIDLGPMDGDGAQSDSVAKPPIHIPSTMPGN